MVSDVVAVDVSENVGDVDVGVVVHGTNWAINEDTWFARSLDAVSASHCRL